MPHLVILWLATFLVGGINTWLMLLAARRVLDNRDRRAWEQKHPGIQWEDYHAKH